MRCWGSDASGRAARRQCGSILWNLVPQYQAQCVPLANATQDDAGRLAGSRYTALVSDSLGDLAAERRPRRDRIGMDTSAMTATFTASAMTPTLMSLST